MLNELSVRDQGKHFRWLIVSDSLCKLELILLIFTEDFPNMIKGPQTMYFPDLAALSRWNEVPLPASARSHFGENQTNSHIPNPHRKKHVEGSLLLCHVLAPFLGHLQSVFTRKKPLCVQHKSSR